MPCYIVIMFVILSIDLYIFVKTRIESVRYVTAAVLIIVVLIITTWEVFAFSERFYGIYSVAPYNLTYAEVLSSVTQIISFIGGTCVAALGVCYTVTNKQKNNQDKRE